MVIRLSDGALDPIQATRTFPGTAESCGRIRSWIRDILRPCPHLCDSVELVASELFSNAIRHTASGDPGGIVQVTLATDTDSDRTLRLEILDQGPRGDLPLQQAHPVVPPLHAQNGRGLFIVSALSSAWGRLPVVDGQAEHTRHHPQITWVEFPLVNEEEHEISERALAGSR